MLCGRQWVLDGGLTAALDDQGISVSGDPLWSARLLAVNPQAIKKAHTSFLESGAEIVTTASYQASLPGFRDHLGTSQEETRKLMQLSVSLAQEAIKEHAAKLGEKEQKLLVAGSIGPYGACQADGSEYNGKYVSSMSSEDLIEWHRPRMAALVDAGVDLLAIETIPAMGEALAILELLREFPSTKAWLSFSCKDNKHTNYGDSFGVAVKACRERAGEQLVAVGVNCTPPQYLTPLLDHANVSLASLPPSVLPRVVYPNSGETWVAGKGWISGGYRNERWPFLSEVRKWQGLGATVIGGCCRLGPSVIQDIRHGLTSIGDS